MPLNSLQMTRHRSLGCTSTPLPGSSTRLTGQEKAWHRETWENHHGFNMFQWSNGLPGLVNVYSLRTGKWLFIVDL